MAQRKILHNLNYQAIMHPDDKKTVDWLNGLKVPYTTNWEFVREIARYPTDHNIREWYDIFMAGGKNDKTDIQKRTIQTFFITWW